MKLWIARQLNGDLVISRSRFKWWGLFKEWRSGDYETLIYNRFADEVGENLFSEVTFENSPMEVELVLKK